MYIMLPEANSTAYFVNPSRDTDNAASLTKPLLSYSHPHLPLVHTVLSDEALATILPL
jgi:hypothetical protein